MSKKDITIAALLVLLLTLSALFYFSRPDRPEVEDESEEVVVDENGETEEVEEEEVEEVKDLKEIITDFLGSPHQRAPLDDDENLYRTDFFDSTTLVLVSTAKLNSPENPEEEMKKINYYPPGEVSYENRLHYSTYRNKVSDYFEDITAQVAGDYLQSKTVVLNKDRLIDIDWEEEISLDYIEKEDVFYVLENLPDPVGVSFIVEGDEEIGLDIRHEGFLIERERLIHASSSEGMVVEEDFIDFLDDSSYTAVNFFKVNE